jgi:hypothetical protein
MPARRRAPSGCGPKARWLRCSLLACDSRANGNAKTVFLGVGVGIGIGVELFKDRSRSRFRPRPRELIKSHRLFNPAPPEAMLTYNPVCSSLAPCQRTWGLQQNGPVIM